MVDKNQVMPSKDDWRLMGKLVSHYNILPKDVYPENTKFETQISNDHQIKQFLWESTIFTNKDLLHFTKNTGKISQSQNQNDTNTIIAQFVCVIVPIFIIILPFYFTFNNPCLKYHENFRISIFILTLSSFFLAYITSSIFSIKGHFCSSNKIRKHFGLTISFYSAMGSSICYFNMFSLDPDIYHFIYAELSSIVVIILYFIYMFESHHEENCKYKYRNIYRNPLDFYVIFGDDKYKYTLQDFINSSSSVFFVIWVLNMILPIYYSNDIFDDNNKLKCLE